MISTTKLSARTVLRAVKAALRLYQSKASQTLFNGGIYASEDIVPKSDRFRQTAAHISETMTYFEGKLSKEDYTLLEKLRDSHADESNMTNECQFKYGFTLGVLMMCEIFYSPFFPHTE